MYSLSGFNYCEVLLTQGSMEEVLERVREIRNVNLFNDLLHNALYQLTLGLTYLLQGEFQQASPRINRAITTSRTAGITHHLPRGLLARAALFRKTHDFDRARQDLQEVFEIADYSGMRLHLTDYHLEMARLILAEEEEGVCNTPLQETDVGAYCIRPLSLQSHIAAAARLITETGYHRRDAELAKLQQYIG
jgi:tetratricopeptide (TPR) repeat protein